MAEQINIFAENKPGRLTSITQILADHQINIRAIVVADRDNFGIIKILVDNPHKAHVALTTNGYAAALKKILAILVEDKPGGLHQLLLLLSEKGINIIDAYGFSIHSKNESVLCIEAHNLEEASSIITENGYKILHGSELYEI
ncbi:MAG: ACT domain-containing protein [Fibrobacter sp.]|nr:ACT domain-containing protein [Fibrobacter sp.]